MNAISTLSFLTSCESLPKRFLSTWWERGFVTKLWNSVLSWEKIHMPEALGKLFEFTLLSWSGQKWREGTGTKVRTFASQQLVRASKHVWTEGHWKPYTRSVTFALNWMTFSSTALEMAVLHGFHYMAMTSLKNSTSFLVEQGYCLGHYQ